MEKLFICPVCHKELSDQWVEGKVNSLCKNDDCYVYDVVVHRTVKSYAKKGNRIDYVVIIPELHYQEVIVQANSKEEALNLAHAGDGDYGDSYYGRMLEKEEKEWDIKEVEEVRK